MVLTLMLCPKWVKMEGSQRIRRGAPFLKRWEMIGENVCGPFKVVRWGEVKANPLAFRNKGSFVPFDRCAVLCSERVDNGTVLCGVYSTMAFRNKGSFVPFDRCGVLCSERVDNGTVLCGVYSTIRDDWVPVLVVNVAKFDDKLLGSLRREKWKTIESDESWVFAIESQECEVMNLISCFQYTETKMMDPAPQVPLFIQDTKKLMMRLWKSVGLTCFFHRMALTSIMPLFKRREN